ncbi:MAG: tryptophan--tRNA ligase, partial [Rhodospirillales bacterium]|nr:tryptophan--tRNA ligase [Rhodospirillales bacterium]
VGLYAYPNLMAADILLYLATHVPVGEDQKQHLELTRDIAQKFNHDFGVEFFPVVEPLIFDTAARVMSLRDGTRKMSKSDTSDMTRINMTDDADMIAKKIRKARTDPEPLPESIKGFEGRAEAENLMGIYAGLSDMAIDEVCEKFGGGQFSDFKRELGDLAVAVLDPIQARMRELLADPAQIDAVLKDGSERAQAMADPILAQIHDIIGFVRP